MAKQSKEWTLTEWPFDRETAKTLKPVYTRKIGRVRFYLYPSEATGGYKLHTPEYQAEIADTWHYCASAGANSDLSHSGFVTEKGLDAAKRHCETKVPTR